MCGVYTQFVALWRVTRAAHETEPRRDRFEIKHALCAACATCREKDMSAFFFYYAPLSVCAFAAAARAQSRAKT